MMIMYFLMAALVLVRAKSADNSDVFAYQGHDNLLKAWSLMTCERCWAFLCRVVLLMLWFNQLDAVALVDDGRCSGGFLPSHP